MFVCLVLQFGDAGGELCYAHLQEVVAVFPVAEAVAAGHKGVVVLLVDGEVLIAGQQPAYFFKFLFG